MASCTTPSALCAFASRPRPYIREQGRAPAASQPISNLALFKIRFRGRACGSCGRASPPQRPCSAFQSAVSTFPSRARTRTHERVSTPTRGGGYGWGSCGERAEHLGGDGGVLSGQASRPTPEIQVGSPPRADWALASDDSMHPLLTAAPTREREDDRAPRAATAVPVVMLMLVAMLVLTAIELQGCVWQRAAHVLRPSPRHNPAPCPARREGQAGPRRAGLWCVRMRLHAYIRAGIGITRGRGCSKRKRPSLAGRGSLRGRIVPSQDSDSDSDRTLHTGRWAGVGRGGRPWCSQFTYAGSGVGFALGVRTSSIRYSIQYSSFKLHEPSLREEGGRRLVPGARWPRVPRTTA